MNYHYPSLLPSSPSFKTHSLTLLCVKQCTIIIIAKCLIIRLSSSSCHLSSMLLNEALTVLSTEEMEPFSSILLAFLFSGFFFSFFSSFTQLGLCLFVIPCDSCWLDFSFQISPMTVDVTWIKFIVFGFLMYDFLLTHTGHHFIFENAFSLNCHSQLEPFSTSRKLTIAPQWREIDLLGSFLS